MEGKFPKQIKKKSHHRLKNCWNLSKIKHKENYSKTHHDKTTKITGENLKSSQRVKKGRQANFFKRKTIALTSDFSALT